jgi:hypothetical protein
VAASAIYYAAHHRRREMSVGYPTLGAIYGNRIAPGYLDRHLAKSGVDSQMTGQPVAPDRPNNLWHPVPGDHGAHGIFDAQSGSCSPQLWANTHRGWIAAAGLLAAGLGLILKKA